MVGVGNLESMPFVFFLTCCAPRGNACLLLMPTVADLPPLLTDGIVVLLELPVPRAKEPTFPPSSLMFDVKGTAGAAVTAKALSMMTATFNVPVNIWTLAL